MNEFKKKWDSDHRFQTKIKLLLYTLFVVFVAIFAISNQPSITEDELEDKYNEDSNQLDEFDAIIKIPNEYKYTINIIVNDNDYQYTGTKTTKRENITKKINNKINRYIYENDNYYKEQDDNYILCSKEEIYDIVNSDYLNLTTINQYLSKSTKVDNQYLVYLKDIILGNNSDDYIQITINENNIEINYTSLVKTFDKSIEKYLVSIKIENIE